MKKTHVSLPRITTGICLSALFAMPMNSHAEATTEWITQPYESGGNHANGSQPVGDITSDGRYIVFSSRATGLHPDQPYYGGHVYLFDRVTENMELVSRTHDGSPPVRFGSNSCGAYNGSISADGRYVAFGSSCENLVPEGTDPWGNIFIRDLATGITKVILPNLYRASVHSISGNGRYITYTYYNDDRLYIYDLETDTSEVVNEAIGGASPNGYTSRSRISYDGRYVAYLSEASNLVPDDNNGRTDAFIHDRLTGETERVSVGANGEDSSYGAERAVALSDNGRYVAFDSRSTNLIPGGTNQRARTYVRDRLTGETSLENVAPDGVTPSGYPAYSYLGGLSGNGRYVVFADTAPNLVDGDNNAQADVFIRDRVNGVTEIINISDQGVHGAGANVGVGTNPVSLNGEYVVFFSSGDLVEGPDEDDGNGFDLYVRAVSRMK